MPTKPVHVAPGSVRHAIDPRTGKPFANIAEQIPFEIAEKLHARMQTAVNLAHRALQKEGRRPRHEKPPTVER
jgi:hypothetical protein